MGLTAALLFFGPVVPQISANDPQCCETSNGYCNGCQAVPFSGYYVPLGSGNEANTCVVPYHGYDFGCDESMQVCESWDWDLLVPMYATDDCLGQIVGWLQGPYSYNKLQCDVHNCD